MSSKSELKRTHLRKNNERVSYNTKFGPFGEERLTHHSENKYLKGKNEYEETEVFFRYEFIQDRSAAQFDK